MAPVYYNDSDGPQQLQNGQYWAPYCACDNLHISSANKLIGGNIPRHHSRKGDENLINGKGGAVDKVRQVAVDKSDRNVSTTAQAQRSADIDRPNRNFKFVAVNFDVGDFVMIRSSQSQKHNTF